MSDSRTGVVSTKYLLIDLQLYEPCYVMSHAWEIERSNYFHILIAPKELQSFLVKKEQKLLQNIFKGKR